MTKDQKIIRAKVGVLELAKQLGNVSQACGEEPGDQADTDQDDEGAPNGDDDDNGDEKKRKKSRKRGKEHPDTDETRTS